MYRNNFSDGRMQNRRNNFGIREASCMNQTCQNSDSSCMTSTCQNSDSSCMRSACQNSDSSCMNQMNDMALAMAYVPWQHFNTLYELPTALQIGTIFPELNKPFRGSKGGMKCPCRQ